MKKYLFYFFVLLPFSVLSQNLDSLKMRITTTSGVEKAIAYHDVIALLVRQDIQKAMVLLTEAEEFSASQKDPIIRSYFLLGKSQYYSMTGRLDSATVLFEEALATGTKENNSQVQIKANSGLGKNWISAGNPEKGLTHLFEALRLLDAHPDQEASLKVRVNIMWAYLELKRYQDCINFGRESLKGIGPRLAWISVYIYNNMAVSFGALTQLDSAKIYIDKGIAGAEKTGDTQSLANGHFILGTIYSNSGKYDLAIDQYLMARPYREKVGNPFFIVSDLYAISDLYFHSGDYTKGVKAGLEGLKLAEQYDLKLKFEGVYGSLAQNYEGLRDYKNASKYYNLWAIAKDSVYKNATTNAIAEMQTKYESEKKEQQIVLQNSQLAAQETKIRMTYLVIGALTVIVTLVIVILFLARTRFKREQALLKSENDVLVREAFIEATIQSQESERKRFAQDLHDSMGQLISSLRLILTTLQENPSLESRVDLVGKSEMILDEMYREIRSVAFNLMPQTLIQEGLLPALQEMARRVNQSGKVAVTASGFDVPARFSELQEISLYRVIQEWTNNAIKYSGAAKIHIQLVGHDHEVTLTIEDDGNGFDVAALEQGGGNGWKNIQSRLNLVKAQMEIDSVVGRKGTTFILNLPVEVKVAR